MSRFRSLLRPTLLALKCLSASCLAVALLLIMLMSFGTWSASAASSAQPLPFNCSTVSEIPQTECQALVSLYNSTGGTHWISNTGWLDTPTPCTWFGVTCGTGTVVQLDLHSNNLAGPLPSELAALPNLTTLYLQNNQLTGVIPDLRGMSSLAWLYLRYNQLTGQVPDNLSALTNLSRLWLDHNALTGTIPLDLTNIPTLEQLSLGNNPLSGQIPDDLSKLTNLTVLLLYNNGLSGTIPNLSNLTKLQVLGIYMNPLQSGPIPGEITQLTKLQTLWLASSNLTGTIPDLSNLTELTSVHLGNNDLTGNVPDLRNSTHLASLYLGANRLSGTIPLTLGNHSTLTVLDLSYNQLRGPVPQELCQLTNTVTSTLTLGYNALSLAPTPDCPLVLDPSWMKTQTVPPTNIVATAISTDSIRLTWTPIAYLADGGGYEVRYSAVPGDPATYAVAATDIAKSASSYVVGNLAAGTTYYFALRTHTPPHSAPGTGLQRNDLWSGYSADIIAATLIPAGTLVTVKEETPTGKPISGTEVLAYQGSVPVAHALSNTHGQVVFDSLQVGDVILARSLQHEQPSGKAGHEGWSYRTYRTNLDVDPSGVVAKPMVEQPGRPLTTTVKKDNTLVLFNLVVGTDFSADPAQLAFLRDQFSRASSFLYDVTDGQFAFGQVAIYDDEQRTTDADVRITQPSQDRPASKMGGIVASAPFTYTSSTGKVSTYSPGYFHIRIDWASAVSEPECDGFCRTLVHEFAHYALFLYDEYERPADDGTMLKTHCTSPGIMTSDASQPGYASNASIMYQPYKTSELAMRGTSQWSSYCDDTLQALIHGESDWETVTRAYADEASPPASPRWQFKTPLTLGHANPGPEALPIGLTTVTSYDVQPPGTPAAAPPTVTVSPGKEMRVFLFRKQGGNLRSISEVGAPITSTIRVTGLLVGDELKAFTTDGSESGSQTVTAEDQPLVLGPAHWQPSLDARPDAQGRGLELSVSHAEEVDGTLKAMLITPGGTYSQTTTLDSAKVGEFHGFLSFDSSGSDNEGYLWVWGKSQDGSSLEAVTTYRVEEAPGSHEWAYLDLEVNSLDRLLSLSLPQDAVPAGTLILVMPVFQVEPLIGSSVARAGFAESAPLAVPDVRTFEGTAHRISASAAMQKASALTLYYDPTVNPSLDDAHLSIYFYDEGTRKWEEKGGDIDRQNHSVSVGVNRFGVYVLVKTFRSYLPMVLR